MSTAEIQSYKKNFELLESIASKMRSQSQPDIDSLVQDVEMATTAKQACEKRISEVRAAIDAVTRPRSSQ